MAEATQSLTREVILTSTIELRLTEEEAVFLAAVLARVGGDAPERQHQRDITTALHAVGIPRAPEGYSLSGSLTTGERGIV